MSKKKKKGKSSFSLEKFRKIVNKSAGAERAFDLRESTPTHVDYWISTGVKVLDCSIREGAVGGIPTGRIVEIAGEEGTGKSYLCALIACNAVKQHNMDVFYFDSENSISGKFLAEQGVPLDKLLYIQAETAEFVLETMEEIIANLDRPSLFIWDSLAQTPTKRVASADMDPRSVPADLAGVLTHGMKKISIPLANAKSALVCTNHLKVPFNPPQSVKFKMNYGIVDPETRNAPGGKGMNHSYSLRIWLTKSLANKNKILDDKERQIGIKTQAKLVKSRFGTENRSCQFGLLWAGGRIGVMEQDEWFEVCKDGGYLKSRGSWWTLDMGEGKDNIKFQGQGNWEEQLQNPEVLARVGWIVEDVLIRQYSENPNPMSSHEKKMYDRMQAALKGLGGDNEE